MLSILIPTYNYNVFPLVESLWKQSKAEDISFEIIILDDSSNCFLAENESINSLDKCRFIKNKINLGRTQTRNLLAKQAKYDWLLFLDADVMPVNSNFIKNYYNQIQKEYDAILGGIQYPDFIPDFSKILRYKYGKSREEVSATIRNKKPFSSILSANMLLKKDTFFTCNYCGEKNYYGMDNFFSYQLFKNKFTVYHINNPVYHFGLESNELFLQKSLYSVKMRKYLFENFPGIETLNPILKKYKIIKKLYLKKPVVFAFKILKPFLKKSILCNNPSLFCFDIYRIGYLCSLTKNDL